MYVWIIMKKNLVPLLGIAFVVAIVSTGIFYGLFVGKLKMGGSGPSGPIVVVASRDMVKGTAIQPTDLKLAPAAGGAALAGTFTSVDQLAGMSAVEPILQNEPVVAARVASAKTGAGAGMGIPSGMRAVSTHVTDSSGVVSLLKAGHKVDVQLASPTGVPAELRTILQNVEVLRVDAPTDQRTVPVVTLLVTPEEGDMLAIGDSSARIRLALRNPLDQGQTPTSRQTLPPLFAKPAPARSPQAAQTTSQ